MKNFVLTLPTKIVFGLNSAQKITKHLKGLGKKALLVTGKSSAEKYGYLKLVTDQLKNSGLAWHHFNEIEPNPRVSTIDKAAEIAKKENCDFVIALGGGSAMDAAKCIALAACNEGSIYDYAYRGEEVSCKPFNKALPLCCIPTFAATSSETDAGAVVTNWETKEKIVVHGYPLFPAVSIIDPKLTLTVGRESTVDGAIDIISHVIEEYLSSAVKAPLPDRFTESIIASVAEALSLVLENLEDLNARSTLSWASSVALSGFLKGRSGSYPIHAVEHAISAHYDIAHGRGLALLLPHFLRYDAKVIPQKIRQLVNRSLFHFHQTHFKENQLEDALDAFESWLKSVGAYTRLSDLKIGKEKFKQLADDTIRLYGTQQKYLPNIRPLERKDIINILNNAG